MGEELQPLRPSPWLQIWYLGRIKARHRRVMTAPGKERWSYRQYVDYIYIIIIVITIIIMIYIYIHNYTYWFMYIYIYYTGNMWVIYIYIWISGVLTINKCEFEGVHVNPFGWVIKCHHKSCELGYVLWGSIFKMASPGIILNWISLLEKHN